MSKLEEFVLSAKKTINPDDIISAMLSKIEREDVKKDPDIFHIAIYNLKNEPDFAEILKEFDFDLSGLSPFSEILDRVIFRLETACILNTMNPSYAHYHISKEAKTRLIENSRTKFQDASLEKLDLLSRRFEELMN